MKKIIIASDSFKGSARSMLVADSIARGIYRVSKEVEIQKYAIADGGEGTVEAVIETVGGTYYHETVTNPYGEQVNARFGMIDNCTAIIEMAEASGLQFKKDTSNPELSTSYGTGELILAAMKKGARHFYIGLGGSATIDGGAGMLQALGVKLLDRSGENLGTGIRELDRLDSIDDALLDPRVKTCTWTVLSDVNNPLTGSNGATAVFGPQKGVSKSAIQKNDDRLKHFADKVKNGQMFKEVTGAGAAGGLGFSLLAFFNAHLKSGIDEVIRLTGLEAAMQNADLVITGEGKMDGQSAQGKAPVGVARLAKQYNLPVIAVVGGRENNLSAVYECGIDLVIDIVNQPMSLEEAIRNVEVLLTEAGETAYRAYLPGQKS